MPVTPGLTPEQDRIINEGIYSKMMSDNDALFKEAVDEVKDYTRVRVREDVVSDLIMPPLTPRDDQYDRDLMDENPTIIIDIEPDSPGATTLAWSDFPEQHIMKARRYRVKMHRIASKKFAKDEIQLKTWIADLRQIFSDHAVRDVYDKIDSRFFRGVNATLVSSGTTLAATGTAQWQTLYGGISRDTLWESVNVLPSTPNALEATCACINHLTAKEFNKFGRGEAGGDMSQDLLINGFQQKKFLNIDNWVITIKKNLVPNFSIFFFADPRFIGKSYEATPLTMWAKRDAWMLYFFHYCLRGGAIGNVAGVARVDFR
jgi:hypothetical protein